MSLLLNNAEGQATGTAVTTGTTATGGSTASQVLGATGSASITHSSVSPLQGLISYLFTTTGNIQSFIAWQDAAASASMALRFNFSIATLPTSDHLFAEWRSTGASLGGLTIGAGGAFRCNIGSGSTSNAGTMSINTNYRFEAQSSTFGVASTANLSYQLYADDQETPIYSLTTPNGTSAAQVQLVRFGRPASAGSTSGMGTFRIDNVALFVGSAAPLGAAEPQRAASDSSLFSESIGQILQGRTVIDLASFSDPSPALTAGATVVDSSALSEAATETGSDDGTDLSTLSEASSLALTGFPVDSATQSELSGLDQLSLVTDSMTLGDSSSLAQSTAVAAADNWTLADSSVLSQSASIVDSATQSDSSALTQSYTATDTCTLTEGTSGLVQGYVANDSATQSEGTTVLAITANVSDGSTMVDASTIDNNPLFSVTDNATQSEGASTTVNAALLNDSATQSEAASIVVVSLDRTDSATQGDGSGAMDWTTPVVDSSTLSDSSSLFSGADPTASETHTLGEVAGIVRASSTTDGFTMSESAMPLVGFTPSDFITMTESSLLEISILANDTSGLLEEVTKDQVFNVEVQDVSELAIEFAYVVESDADESEYTRIQMQFPNLLPVTRIDIRRTE